MQRLACLNITGRMNGKLTKAMETHLDLLNLDPFRLRKLADHLWMAKHRRIKGK